MPHCTPDAVIDRKVTVNRRLTIRHACGADTQVTMAEGLSPFQKVRVHDISQGGVALILPSAPAVGATIFLQVSDTVLDFTYDLAAEVCHATPWQRGSWLVGVAFDRDLSADEIAGLI